MVYLSCSSFAALSTFRDAFSLSLARAHFASKHRSFSAVGFSETLPEPFLFVLSIPSVDYDFSGEAADPHFSAGAVGEPAAEVAQVERAARVTRIAQFLGMQWPPQWVVLALASTVQPLPELLVEPEYKEPRNIIQSTPVIPAPACAGLCT